MLVGDQRAVGPAPIETGKIIRHDTYKYVTSKFLGAGTYSSCYAALRTNNTVSGDEDDVNSDAGATWVAMKFIPVKNMVDTYTKMNVENEIKALSTIEPHPYIIKMLDHFKDDEYVYIILELCAGMSLCNFIKTKKNFPGTCSETRSREYIGQLLKTVQHLRSQNMVHRDIKLGNILLNDRKTEIKLADFGMAEKLTSPEHRLTLRCGTPHYVAPEIMHPQMVDKQGYAYEVDIWSIGVCMYTMLTGRHPFRGKREQVYAQLLDPKVQFPENIKISVRAQEVIKGMLALPKDRWSLEQIINHPFFATRRESKTTPGLLY